MLRSGVPAQKEVSAATVNLALTEMEFHVLIWMSVKLVSIAITRKRNVPTQSAVTFVHVNPASREMELSVRT